MSLGWIEFMAEKGKTVFPGGLMRLLPRADNLSTFMCQLSVAATSWSRKWQFRLIIIIIIIIIFY
jgi:hypothetical protein